MAYHSETHSEPVHKYPTYDKGMYSIIQAYWKWKHYILGKQKVIHTDQSLYSSYKPRENYKMDAIKIGPHIYNSSTSTLNTRKVAPNGSSTTSVDL